MIKLTAVSLLQILTQRSRDSGNKFLDLPKLSAIEAILKSGGAYSRMLDGKLYRGYVHKKFTKEKPWLMISSHIDSVYEYPFCSIEPDGEFLRGTFDNSGTNASVVNAMLTGGMSPQIVVMFTGGEERGLLGAYATVDALQKDPLWDSLIGVMSMDVTYHGWMRSKIALENVFVNEGEHGEARLMPKYTDAASLTEDLLQVGGMPKTANSRIGFSQPDEGVVYYQAGLNGCSLCIPIGPTKEPLESNDFYGWMHSDSGTYMRVDDLITHTKLIPLLGNKLVELGERSRDGLVREIGLVEVG